VTIEIEDDIPDVLQRVAVLHSAFIRVVVGTRLVEVIEADYEKGKIVAVVESRRSRPNTSGKVCIRYESCPNGIMEKLNSKGGETK
jgi:hypothetical protein